MFLLQHSLEVKVDERIRLEKTLKVYLQTKFHCCFSGFLSQASIFQQKEGDLRLKSFPTGGGGQDQEGRGGAGACRDGLRHLPAGERQTVHGGSEKVII